MTSPSPSPGEKLPIRVRPQTRAERVRPTVAELTLMVNQIGGEGDHFLVVERVPYAHRVFIQTYRDGAGSFNVEYRDGGTDQFAAEIEDPAIVAGLMLDWARAEPEWESGVDWAPSYQHPQVDVTPLSRTAKSSATRLARRYIDEGFRTFETMAQRISECAEADDPVTIEQAEALLEPLWIQRVAEQRSWPAVTDVDRVEAAFERLDDNGIVARTHWSCCQDCGTIEIGAEATDTDHGYVFFHHQDTERAVDGALFLAFGAYSGEAVDATAVGHEIVKTLAAEGLTTEWDQTLEQRIKVIGLDWKKRLE